MTTETEAQQGDRRARQQREVDANFEVFEEKFDDLYREHPGKFALMKNREVVDFFDTDADAFRAAKLLFNDGLFSVQKIDNQPPNLGWMGYALSHGAHH